MTMAKFYVGQRVRILWSSGWPELKGETGIIVSKSPDRGVLGDSEWLVAPDVWGTAEAPHPSDNGATRFGPSSEQLEPLIKPDNEVGSWEKLGWHPSQFLQQEEPVK